MLGVLLLPFRFAITVARMRFGPLRMTGILLEIYEYMDILIFELAAAVFYRIYKIGVLRRISSFRHGITENSYFFLLAERVNDGTNVPSCFTKMYIH